MISCLRRSHTRTARNACCCASQSARQADNVIASHAAMVPRQLILRHAIPILGLDKVEHMRKCNHDCEHALLMAGETELCCYISPQYRLATGPVPTRLRGKPVRPKAGLEWLAKRNNVQAHGSGDWLIGPSHDAGQSDSQI
jgi:hypothetical protein